METRDKQITYAVNRQGGIYLIHNSHTFWRSKPMANDNFRWRCSRSLDYGGRCKSRLVTGSEDQLMEVSEHNHDANVPALIAKLQADEAIEHAIQNPSIDPHQIFAEFENKDCHNLEIAMKKPSMRSFVKTINKARAKALALENKLIKSE